SMSGTLDGLWDKARLGQLFSNLLSNAVQYGSKDAPIRMTVKGQPADVVISIHNEGIPVSLQHIDTIFDAMTRGDESADVSGVRSQNLGLGLFISREIVSAHGGTIGVESGEGDGTTFTIQLPRTATGPIAPIPHPVMPGAQELDRRS
ncbi:MAG TPA: sensor histidine kinase, partial [Asticcacaulis sp.]|nr:sensor histidine kinase [Asticcacaulis sp.]